MCAPTHVSITYQIEATPEDGPAQHLRHPLNGATPVAKLLEPQTKHIISSGGFTSSSRPELTSKSDHLYNGRQMLQRYESPSFNCSPKLISRVSGFDIHEVFSRGQNPQHWHISDRERKASAASRMGKGCTLT